MWEKEKMQAFSPFPTMFSKGFLYRIIKNPDSVVKSKIQLRVTKFETGPNCKHLQTTSSEV